MNGKKVPILIISVAAILGFGLLTFPLLNQAFAGFGPRIADACSPGDEICKRVFLNDDDFDQKIEVGEEVSFLVSFWVENESGEDWEKVTVKDNFGAQLKLIDCRTITGTIENSTKGKSEKVSIFWNIGDLDDGDSAHADCFLDTDITPGGEQSYTEEGVHEFNSGAVVKICDGTGKKSCTTPPDSFETGSIDVTVVPDDGKS